MVVNHQYAFDPLLGECVWVSAMQNRYERSLTLLPMG